MKKRRDVDVYPNGYIIFSNHSQTIAGDRLTYNWTTLVWAPYGHLWRNLKWVSIIMIVKIAIRIEKNRTILWSHLTKKFKIIAGSQK